MRAWFAFLPVMLAIQPVFAANEDTDLDLIPQAAQTAPVAAPAATPGQRNYLEDALSFSIPRQTLAVPFPPPQPASWEDRLFLDSRDEWRLGDGLTVTYSGRFNLRAENDIPFPSHETVRNELREAYVSWQPAAGLWLDLGRINVKSGVAAGYNPTDFFRTRAVVEPLTVDPGVLREDRLGTLMALGQYVWAGGSITAAFAPRVTLPTALYTNLNLPSFDPMLDRTNAADRMLLKASATVADGLSPELLLYHQGNQTEIGTNLTVGIGQSAIGYIEWAGGVQNGLIDEALRYGRQTGSIPTRAPAPLPFDADRMFRYDLSVGLSYTTATKITFNLEYHYHQAGLSPQDWNNWFTAASRLGRIPGVDAALWFIRAYAQDQQQPISRHTGFVRADWTNAFVTNLELTALASVDLQDGSGVAQATADYFLSRVWTVGGLASFTFGGRRSDFGSLPQSAGVLVRLVRYL